MSAVRSNHWLSAPDTGGDGLFHRCLGGSAAAGALFLAVVTLAPLPKRVLQLASAEAPRVARILFTPAPAAAWAAGPAVRASRARASTAATLRSWP